jgi:hypothetical protein
MKMFEALDRLDKIYKKEDDNKPIIKNKNISMFSTIKEYKQNYYLFNKEIYDERNKLYRTNNKNSINKN